MSLISMEWKYSFVPLTCIQTSGNKHGTDLNTPHFGCLEFAFPVVPNVDDLLYEGNIDGF